MSTKKQRKTKQIKAKKQKKNTRLFFFSLMILIAVGFIVFFIASLLEYVYPPVAGERQAASREKTEMTFYFADANERFLVEEKRYITKATTPEGQVIELTAALIDGPHTELIPTIPAETVVKDVVINDDMAVIDFNEAFIDHHPGGSTSEIMTIYSLANTITKNMPDLTKVSFLVNGKKRETLTGHMRTNRAFRYNTELVVEK